MNFKRNFSVGIHTLVALICGALPLSVLMLAACSGGSGASAPATVTTSSYSAGGAVSGLIGTVVLQDNGGDNLSLTANGNFTFATKILNGNTYKVTVLTQPTGQTCSVSTGAGTVSGSNVSNVAVTCSTNAYTVGGNVSGLTGSVVLQDNNGDNLSVTANGAITFATPVAFGSPYSVTVLTQPTGMNCSIANGTGTIAAANVSNVAITCATNTYTVGGTVTGLNGSVVLQDNGADNSTVSVNGPFNFPTAVAYGNPYSVSILTQPTRQFCSVNSGAGTVAGNISNVGVSCLSQLGGSIQGAALNLSKAVSTYAGVAGTFADGTGAAARFNAPFASVSDGTNLYVTDTSNNAIRKNVIATGVVTTLAGSPTGALGAADGTGTAATFNSPSGITIDTAHANLYVADSGNNKIRKIVIATGAVSTFAGSGVNGVTDGTGIAALFSWPNGITTDGTFLYEVEAGPCILRKIEIATQIVTTMVPGGCSNTDGIGAAAGFANPMDITTDGANLYVVDNGSNNVRKVVIATNTVSTLAGAPASPAVGANALGATDATGTAALFNNPQGIITDGINLYVADGGNNKIRQIVIATGVVSSLTGVASTASAFGKVDGTPGSATFGNPQGVSYDAVHNSLFVADANNNDVRVIALNSTTVSTLAGMMGPDGAGATATFNAPYSTATDGANLYVADYSDNTIRQIVIATGVTTTLAGQTGVAGAADGTGTAATFSHPWGITTDGTNLYVTDSGNNKIRQIVIATGQVSSLTGTVNIAMAGGVIDGLGTAATFNNPWGISTDGTNLYVADRNNQKIRQIVIATGVTSSLTGTVSTTMGIGAADGAGTAATFNYASGITTDGTNLYVVDQNNKIRQIVIATGLVTSLTGTANTAMAGGAADAAGTAATFNNPQGITTDGTNLYVADSGNNKIRQIVIATGLVTGLTGTTNTAMGIGALDGAGMAATFYSPSGITTDGKSLYVTDTTNNTIRKIQ